jgi:hypothetical protein
MFLKSDGGTRSGIRKRQAQPSAKRRTACQRQRLLGDFPEEYYAAQTMLPLSGTLACATIE